MRLPGATPALLWAALLHTAAGSNCAWDTVQVLTYTELTTCLSEIPYSEAWRNGTIDTISTTLEQYAFLDLIKNTGPPWNTEVDILPRLAEIRATTYPSDSAFQDDVLKVMASLKDAHTEYRKPNCYKNMYFRQPFSLDVKMVDSRQAIFLGNAFPLIEDYNASLVGLEVTAVDGLEVLSSISEFADEHVTISKDQGARFNYAVVGSLYDPVFVVRHMRDNAPPSKETMTWTLKSADGDEFDVDLKWTGFVLSGASTDPSGCAATVSPGAEKGRDKDDLKKVIQEQIKVQMPLGAKLPHLGAVVNSQKPVESASSSSWTSITLLSDPNYGNMTCLLSPDNTTGVLRIDSFMYDSEVGWAEAIYEALTIFKAAGVETLLVDVLSNPGGVVCYAFETAAFLVESEYQYLLGNGRVRSSVYDMKATDSMAAVETELGNFQGFLDPTTGVTYPDGTFYTEGPSKRRGGTVSSYSEPFGFDCAGLVNNSYLDDDNPMNYSLPEEMPMWFDPERILVLTDGMCGSSCATFLARLQENNFARVVGVGGIKYQDLQSQSFAGGFVTSIEYLNMLFEEAGQTTIPPFPTTAAWQVTWGELYSEVETGKPTQYVNLPTDFNIDYWDYHRTDPASQIALYELAIETAGQKKGHQTQN